MFVNLTGRYAWGFDPVGGAGMIQENSLIKKSGDYPVKRL
jgi:hypothetical protein